MSKKNKQLLILVFIALSIIAIPFSLFAIDFSNYNGCQNEQRYMNDSECRDINVVGMYIFWVALALASYLNKFLNIIVDYIGINPLMAAIGLFILSLFLIFKK